MSDNETKPAPPLDRPDPFGHYSKCEHYGTPKEDPCDGLCGSCIRVSLDALEAAEARIARVEALVKEWSEGGMPGNTVQIDDVVDDLRRALKGTP